HQYMAAGDGKGYIADEVAVRLRHGVVRVGRRVSHARNRALKVAAEYGFVEFECFFAGTWKAEIGTDAGHDKSPCKVYGECDCRHLPLLVVGASRKSTAFKKEWIRLPW